MLRAQLPYFGLQVIPDRHSNVCFRGVLRAQSHEIPDSRFHHLLLISFFVHELYRLLVLCKQIFLLCQFHVQRVFCVRLLPPGILQYPYFVQIGGQGQLAKGNSPGASTKRPLQIWRQPMLVLLLG